MWSQIIGHKDQIDQLKKTVSNSKLPNAFLFAGLGGIGKNIVAQNFAKSLFCKTSPDICGECLSCQKVDKKIHPDLFFVDPTTDKILIEQVRELQEKLRFHPLEAERKLVIINDADMMTESAANSLLKILEEPPPDTHFILVSSYPNNLLATIRSRCRIISFSPLKEEDVALFLMKNYGYADNEAKKISKISQGSIGAVADLDLPFMSDVLDRFNNIMVKANSADIIELAERWSKEEEKSRLIFDLLASYYRDLICGLTKTSYSQRKLENDFFEIMKSRELFLNTTVNKQLLFEQLLFSLVK